MQCYLDLDVGRLVSHRLFVDQGLRLAKHNPEEDFFGLLWHQMWVGSMTVDVYK